MSRRRFDLPLEQTAASRFLPWSVGGLLYLAVVALALAALADDALRKYGARAKLVTVTLPSASDATRGERQMARAVDLLLQTRGVTSAVPVPAEDLEALIEPWLGSVETTNGLPLPRLIDVTLDPRAQPDLVRLQERLRDVVEGATIGVEALSRDRAERLALFLRGWGSGAGVAALLGTLVLVVFMTRLSLGMNAETIELLRCMGASDRYLARQFERHALLSGLRGGVIGFALAVGTVLAMLYSGRRMELTGAIELTLRPLDWILLACVPVIIAFLVMAAARTTAIRGLARPT